MRLKMMTQQVLTSLRPSAEEYNDKREDVSRSKSREKPDENIGYESFDGVAKAPPQKTNPVSREMPAKNKP